MWSSVQEYHRPKSIQSALRLIGRVQPHTVLLAGGTWLVAMHDPSIQAVVDLRDLDLVFIKNNSQRLRLGAMTTIQTLVEHPLVQKVGGGLLAKASQHSAQLSTRNVATLGGTLAVGDSTSEVLLALLALDAQVVIHSPIWRETALDALLSDHPAHLSPQVLIKEVYIPTLPAESGGALAEVRPTPRDHPIVNAAALVVRKGRVCRIARIALGGIAPHPIRLREIEAMFFYQPFDTNLLSDAAEAVSDTMNYPDDSRASAAYRRAMVAIMVTRALQEAWEMAIKE